MIFPKLLIHWYLQNKRDLPWRDTNDPYFIWLSEIMLQQTRVAQGLPYFFAFTESFPTVFDLAEANEEQVLKLWQGLGYYSRARNLHNTAQFVANECNGIFPGNYQDLLKLKGIGDYTAAAIASFAYNEAVPVVDGNVFRVLSSYFGIETDIATTSAKREFASLAFQLMPKGNPAIFNQAIMEFGALQCVPRNPDCTICPLNFGCFALQKRKVHALPVKTKKAKAKSRFFNYLIISDEFENTILQKRTGKGIWENLYEFPLIETESETDINAILPMIDIANEIISVEEINSQPIIHKLTHQHLHINFRKIRVKGLIKDGINCSELNNYPMPIVLFNFVAEHWK